MRILFMALILFAINSYSQSSGDILNSNFSEKTFPSSSSAKKRLKKAISVKDMSLFTKLNPLFYLGSGGLYFYQNVISEQFMAECTYHISCSEYTKRAISNLGLIPGILTGIDQLNNCFTGAREDYPGWKINSELKIDNSQDFELH